jgi:16S rRNA (adenine1518-N6/adenine1519-N6)-dimethyltransferase
MPGSRRSYQGHVAKSSLGQNFLVDPNLQRKIAESIEPGRDDEVVEIGPGMGALTRHLVGRVGNIVLVELDDSLATRLQEIYADDTTVRVLHRDILDLDLAEAVRNPSEAKVIGNIPYNITTPILFHLLENRPRPAMLVLMVQREVADRILASPGNKTYGALAVGVQSVARVTRVLQVARTAFRPAPDVDSTVIRITPIRPEPLDVAEEAALRRLTRAAFGHRRKQFQRILRDAVGVTEGSLVEIADSTGLDLRARPETLSPADFIRLARALRDRGYLAR